MNAHRDEIPEKKSEGTAFLDLHVHSAHSPDGRTSLRELFTQARTIGLHGLAITDHNSVKGCVEGKKLSKEFPEILFVPGLEVTTAEGHILALNITDTIPHDRTIAETIELIHAKGGITIAGHPYRLWSGIGELAVLGNLDSFDAIESFNARNIFAGNRKAKTLVMKTGKPETGGSDCHMYKELGGGYTIFENPVESVEDVIEEILRGQTMAGSGNFISIGMGKILRQGTHCVSAWFRRGFRDI